MSELTKVARIFERTQIRAEVAHLLTTGRTSEVTSTSSPLLNLHGIPGVGKTMTLLQLRDFFVPSAWVYFLSFNPLDSDELPQKYRDGLAWQPWNEVYQSLSTFVNGSEEALTLSPPDPASRPAGLMVASSKPTTDGPHPRLLLLDDLDDRPLWRWLQKEVLTRLLQVGRPGQPEAPAAAVLTSQMPIYMEYWDLAERCRRKPFYGYKEIEPEEIIAEHEVLKSCAPLITYLRDRTDGYPPALNAALKILQDRSKLRKDHAETPRPPSDKVDWSDDERQWLVRIGLLRRLDLPSFRHVLTCEPPVADDGALTVFRLNSFVRKLRAAELLVHYRAEELDELHAGLRTWAVAAHHAEPQLREIYKKLADFYLGRAQKRPIDEPQSVLDWLYYSTLAGQHAGPEWEGKLERVFTRAIEAARDIVLRSPMADIPLGVKFYLDLELVEHLNKLQVYKKINGFVLKLLEEVAAAWENSTPSDSRQAAEEDPGWQLLPLQHSGKEILNSVYDRLLDRRLSSLRDAGRTPSLSKSDITASLRYVFLASRDKTSIDLDQIQQALRDIGNAEATSSIIVEALFSRGVLVEARDPSPIGVRTSVQVMPGISAPFQQSTARERSASIDFAYGYTVHRNQQGH